MSGERRSLWMQVVARGGLLVVALASISSKAGELVLAERGKMATYTIVRSVQASPSEAYAAEELRDFIVKATDVTLPIATDALPIPDKAILIGSVAGADATLGEDGFRLKVDGSLLRVIGSPKRGALYGVYELLERYVGCRWYASWHTVVPTKDRVCVPEDLSDVQVPAFAMRELYCGDVREHPDFAARSRFNGHGWQKIDEKFGGMPFRFGGGLDPAHTFAKLMPVEEFFDTHPEYFSEINGVRHGGRTQLCLSNPDVLRIVTERVLARIRRDPGARFYGVSQYDWKNFCECPKCKAIDEEEGSHAGTMVRFVNAVAERVEKEFPDAIIETLAYLYTRKPPRKTKLRHNVVPCLCTIECDFARPLAANPFDENVKFRADIRGWAKQTDQLYVWDYVTDFTHYTLPFANVLTLQGNLKFFRANKVREIFEQGANPGRHADFAELKAWLISKWMWNPDLPSEPLLQDFFNGYYGKGSPFVRAYFDKLHALQRVYSKPPNKPLVVGTGPDNPALSDAFLEDAAKLWARAATISKGDPATSYNVRMGSFGVDYMRLERLRENDKVLWLSAKPVELLAFEKEKRLAKSLLDRMEEAKDIRLSESLERHRKLQAEWRALLKLTLKRGAKRGVLQELFMSWERPGYWVSFVDDTKACDGKALKLHNTHSEECVWFRMNRVEFNPGLRYKVRVRARCEKKGNGEAFRAGVYDHAGKVELNCVQLKTSEMSPEYAWYDVCTWVPTPNDRLWFAPGRFDKKGKSVIKGVWIDEIEFIQVD